MIDKHSAAPQAVKQDLIRRSIDIILRGQAPSGAYVACPTYATYNYGWFRDGTFVAHAMDAWHEHASAARFYDWAAYAITARAAVVERAEADAVGGAAPAAADLLHARYTLEGRPGVDEWPNFQLDGFGTLLWGFGRHHGATGEALPAHWLSAARLLVRYLAALWRLPNADCWEEFSDCIAVSTLAAIHAGLHTAALLLKGEPLGTIAADTAGALRALVLERGVRGDHLIKQVDGDDVVDASLLWACVPFGQHALFQASDPVMRGTAAKIERDLVGGAGGVHRYRADTFYGGGEWMLLTALLGEYRLAAGDRAGAERCRDYVAAHASPGGALPEQSSAAVLAPERVAEWIVLWGPVAQPLLWSHAGYLSLCAALDTRERAAP